MVLGFQVAGALCGLVFFIGGVIALWPASVDKLEKYIASMRR